MNETAIRTLTLGYLSLADVGPLEIVAAAGDAGFSSVGLRLTARRPGEVWAHAPVGDAAERRRLAAALADRGLALSNVSAFHLYPEVSLEHLQPVIDASAELGARTLIGCVYREPDGALIEFLSRYAERAGQAGLRIAIETVSYSACPTLASACALLARVDSPVLGLMLDPLHLKRGGSDDSKLAELPADQVCIAQLCDAHAAAPEGVDAATEARTMRLYPGEGGLELGRFVTALPRSAEIELELPVLADRALPPAERARRMRARSLSYLAALGINAR